jgi:hypothetical protein
VKRLAGLRSRLLTHHRMYTLAKNRVERVQMVAFRVEDIVIAMDRKDKVRSVRRGERDGGDRS